MNTLRFRRSAVVVAAAATLPFALAACSGSGSAATSDGAASSAAQTSSAAMPSDGPFGPACAGVPKSGAGSFDGMAKDPVATAASN
ncbi:fasciclin domain-containing protein, partial [Streptomyces sp. NPDC057540]